MLHKRYLIGFFAILLVTMTSCEVIGGIFKAGVWVGILIVLLVVGLIAWVMKNRKQENCVAGFQPYSGWKPLAEEPGIRNGIRI